MTADWKKVFISPQKFHDDIIKLCDLIPKNKYKNLCAIPRGGLIIGVYLSHYLDIPMITSKKDINSKDTLIVDDILDTGVTLKEYSEKKFDTAVIYYKPRSVVVPTYYAEITENSNWITFPFEKADEEPNRKV